jgi:hypothetical protein
VFCQDDGQPWHPDHVSKRFKKLAAQAGVPVVTLLEQAHLAAYEQTAALVRKASKAS